MRVALPALQWYSGGTNYGAGGPVMARRNWSPGPNLAADQLLRDRISSGPPSPQKGVLTKLWKQYGTTTSLCHQSSSSDLTSTLGRANRARMSQRTCRSCGNCRNIVTLATH